jgi:hypothetical protein
MGNVPIFLLRYELRPDIGHAFQLHDMDRFAIIRSVTKVQFRPVTGGEIQPMIREACPIARRGCLGQSSWRYRRIST